MPRAAAILACLLAMLPACRNAPAEERETLRYEVGDTAPDEVPAMRARLLRMLHGDAANPPEEDPHLRAAAAQGLGNIGDPADSDALLEALLGPLSDGSLQVRMECAIALGKLYYARPRDERRARVLNALKQRLAFERNAAGRLVETEFLVRVSMLNTMIALKGRDAAIAVREVASRIHLDLTAPGGDARTEATDRGILDRAIDGLCTLTGTLPAAAAADRVERDDLGEHLFAYWQVQIAQMQEP